MNNIKKKPLNVIGYEFVDQQYIPEGADEYYLRELQHTNGKTHRNLSAYEIEVLVRNNNTSDNWNAIKVSDAFNPELVKNCKFFGLVRIGKLESVALTYHNVCLPVGLYNSTIISCDLGDNVIVNNVNYLSHYIIGNEVILLNIHELHVTDHAKFGNGILKEGESESVRIWVEVRNENAGRRIIPFNGMEPGDAFLWSKYREDLVLMEKFKEYTEQIFDKKRGYYGKIGDRTVIKNTSIIKDVWVGTDAYIKGANKLKNLTINSSAEAPSQIGEGCEIVNGIIGGGCRIFYGVKAVRFVMASHSQLKYGARLINSYLGNNSTISCCEVLNSLIFPAHEQHHNNSFLCAALVMGQSNIAAGATIGSNHNSRAADGEMQAARGFWPGLCVSLKHNSRFASFTLLAKGDYPYELDVQLPFSLVSNEADQLSIMPAYWFMYNLYALARNSEKYVDRDRRIEKKQRIEYDYLAPDSINEIFEALDLIFKWTAGSQELNGHGSSDAERMEQGRTIYEANSFHPKTISVKASGIENSGRTVVLIKPAESVTIYRRLIRFYGVSQIIRWMEKNADKTFEQFKQDMPAEPETLQWNNIGGQLISAPALTRLMEDVKSGEIGSWEAIHGFYEEQGNNYPQQKLEHAWASLLRITSMKAEDFTETILNQLLTEALETKEWIFNQIEVSRSKDYQNRFRKMLYDNEEEMNMVVGSLEENVFINHQREELERFQNSVNSITARLRLQSQD